MPLHLILHIGLPKTGTTSIQRALEALRGALRRQGICYPESRGGAVPALLHRVGMTHGAGPRPDSGGPADRFWNELTTEFRALGPAIGTVVLSGEQCSYLLRSPEQIARLHAKLAPWFATMQVVIYLRRQDMHAASMYAQALRRAILRPPSLEFLEQELSGLYDYANLLRSWQSVFGEGSIIPRIFEPDALLNGDSVADFLGLCGAGPGLAGKRAMANPSMNAEGQKLLLALGKYMTEAGRPPANGAAWRHLAAAITRRYPGRGWQPGRAEAEAMLARYAVSNEAVRRTWFPNRAALFNADFSQLPDTAIDFAAPALSEASYAALLARLTGTSAGSEPDE